MNLFHRSPTVMAQAAVQKSSPVGLPSSFWDIDTDKLFQTPDNSGFEMSVDIFFNARHYTVMDGTTGPEHQHSYRLQVRCNSRGISTEEHVVVGYAILRERMKQVVEAYNNQLLNALPPFRKLQPTTEVLAAVLCQQMKRIVADLPVELVSITIWESPTAAITFYSS